MKISGLSILCEVVRSPLKKFPLVAEIRNNTTDTELATTNTDMATAKPALATAVSSLGTALTFAADYR